MRCADAAGARSAAAADATLPGIRRSDIARRHGHRRSRQADRRPRAGRLRRSRRRQSRAASSPRNGSRSSRLPPTDAGAARRPKATAATRASTGGRLIVIAVDEPNIRFGGAMAIARAANAFIDRLSPSDRIAVAGFGTARRRRCSPPIATRVKRVIARMVGQKQPGRMRRSGPQHRAGRGAGDRQRRPGDVLEPVQNRECTPRMRLAGRARDVPPAGRDGSAHRWRRTTNHDGRSDDLGPARSVPGAARDRRAEDADPHLGGFRADRRGDGHRPRDDGGRGAHEPVRAASSTTRCSTSPTRRMPINPFADRQARAEGLEMLAGAARGTLFTVTGTGQPLVRAHRVGALRLLPARRRVRAEGPRRQAALGPGRRPATRRDSSDRAGRC